MKKHLFRKAILNIKRILLFCSFTALFCLLSCESEKDRDRLKEAFFCTINGEEFYPQKLIGTNWYSISYNKNITEYQPSYFFIGVTSDRFRYADIEMSIYSNKQSIGVGEYLLKKRPKSESDDFNNANWARCYFQDLGDKKIIYNTKHDYVTTDEATGYVNIAKIDTVQQIISGTFYFTAINEFQQKVEVQNGRFNTKYN